MKALLLAAGYATRLYPLTKDRPKPLLPVGGKAICDHILEKFTPLGELDHVYVVTNAKFFPHFQKWREGHSWEEKLTVLNDGTTSEEDRLGAIGDIHFVLSQETIEDDLLVVAGDNLFEFDLQRLVDFFQKHRQPIICVKDFSHNRSALRRYGVVQLDETGRVVHFQEKPEEPASDYAAVGIYLYPKESLSLFSTYLEEGNNPDAPGYFVEWLYKRTPVYGFVFTEDWYDIGDKAMLEHADEVYRSRSESDR